MDKTALHIEKRQYNAALPVWCVYQGDRCLAVCETERRAGEMLRDMEKAKGTAGQGRPSLGGATMLPPKDTPPTLSEIGITKRQSSDWQNVEAMRGSYV